MIAENPLALAYILPADIYVLPNEQQLMQPAPSAMQQPEIIQAEIEVQAAEPVVTYTQPVEQNSSEPTPEPMPQMPKTEPAISAPAATLNYTGGFGRKFLIVVHYPEHENMDATHQAALESTIKRRDLSMDDIAIFNLGKFPATELKEVGRVFKPQKMLLLGKESLPAGLAEPIFNQVTKLGKCDLLYSYSFGEMMGNKDKIKAFWEQVKVL